jgi:putative transposase
MKRLQGYRYRLESKPRHIEPLHPSLGANRFVWNKLLVMNLYRLNNQLPILWYYEMDWFIKLWKQSARALERAFQDGFDKHQPNKKLPIFKKVGKNEAGIQYPQQVVLDENNQVIQSPKLGWVKYRSHRRIEGVVKNVTVSCTGGHFNTVSIQTEGEARTSNHPSTNGVGVDVSIARFAPLSDGFAIEPINGFRKHQQRVAKYQRRLSRKQKSSNNWRKARACVQKILTHIANARKDSLHKATTTISKNQAKVCIEDMQVWNISQSSAGSRETPGKSVGANSGLNQSILDQGWGEFRRQLEYQQVWRGGWVLSVPPHHTRQECPEFLSISAENRKTHSRFHVVSLADMSITRIRSVQTISSTAV